MSNLTIAAAGATTVAQPRPLDRARAISGLISEEALAAERLGRLTDKVAAAMLWELLGSEFAGRQSSMRNSTPVRRFSCATTITARRRGTSSIR